MTRSELNTMKAAVLERKGKASDLDIIVAQVMKLPYGQLKKVLNDDVLAVLAKYGVGDEV
ncbi:MAG: hypothetical protein ACI3V3_04220 [Faecousia sp.]